MPDRLALDGGEPVRVEPFPPWPRATPAAYQAVQRVLESGHWWQSGGGRAEELEEWLQDYHRIAGVLAVTNGTHALELAFRTLGIGPGDEVLVPAITFISTASAASFVGAAPVPVDIDPSTLCLDVQDLKRKLSQRSRVVVPVHIAGQPPNMDAIMAIACDAGIAVVEDAAQAFGAEWQGRRVGTFGDMTIFSFQASKLLSAGEGGALLVRDSPDLLNRARLLANCGRNRGELAFEHRVIGSNFRMTEFQAALLLSQASEYDELWRQRDAAAGVLSRALADDGIVEPVRVGHGVTRMAWYAFPVRVARPVNNEQFAAALVAEGIPAKALFPPFYATPAYLGSLEKLARCRHAEAASREFVWLPHPVLLDGERGAEDVACAVRKVARASTGSPQSLGSTSPAIKSI